MKQYLESFKNDEAGAVTIDWVILTAFIVALLAGGYGLLKTNTVNLTDDIASHIESPTF